MKIISPFLSLRTMTIMFIAFAVTACLAKAGDLPIEGDTVYDLYVSTLGNDSSGDGSEGNPYASIGKAITAATAGQSVFVGAGTYTELGISVNKGITIDGAGADSTFVQAHASKGSASNRVFNITSTANVTIRNMTIRNGKTSASGAGVYIFPSGISTVVYTIDSCEIVDNISNVTASYNSGGGGIFAAPYDNVSSNMTVRILNSTIANNSSTSRGGGIFIIRASNNPTMSSMIQNCTVSGNSASGTDTQAGGGVALHNHTATVNNSTISGNSSTNSSGGGGGLAQRYGTLSLVSSIVAGNSSAGDDEDDIARSTVTLTESRNLVGINEAGGADLRDRCKINFTFI